jgi:PhnB protein
VRETDQFVDFVKRAFGGVETSRMSGSAGGTHIEMRIDDSMIMVGGSATMEPMPAMLHLYVPDVDAVYKQALQAGATSIMEPADQPDGERRGGVQDPFGNQWWMGMPL